MDLLAGDFGLLEGLEEAAGVGRVGDPGSLGVAIEGDGVGALGDGDVLDGLERAFPGDVDD